MNDSAVIPKLLLGAMVATAVIAAASSYLDSPTGARLTGFSLDIEGLSRSIAARFLMLSVILGVIEPVVLLVYSTEKHLSRNFWSICLLTYAMSLFLWNHALMFAQSAR